MSRGLGHASAARRCAVRAFAAARELACCGVDGLVFWSGSTEEAELLVGIHFLFPCLDTLHTFLPFTMKPESLLRSALFACTCTSPVALSTLRDLMQDDATHTHMADYELDTRP